MARIDSAYSYFLSTYGSSMGSRYQSHKKSELRETYNSIIKANKEAPLYKITQTGDVGQFAIDMKEGANSVAMEVANISSQGEDVSSIMKKKIATSSDDSKVDALYVGTGDDAIDDFKMSVQSLATKQTNQGNFLNSNGKDFEEGKYTFDLDTKSNSYEFQFNVFKDDTNFSVQDKLARLVNSADIGLTAEVITNDKGESALSISSISTGLSESDEYAFNISGGRAWKEINTLGIDKVTTPASNSEFTLNGTKHSSMSNTFTVNKTFEVSLKDVTDQDVTIGLMSDTEALSDGVNGLLSSYNNLVSVGLKYSDTHNYNRLYNEVTALAKNSSEDLENIGITMDEDGYLSLDSEKLSETINSGDRDKAFETLNSFKKSMLDEAQKISINPMNYVNKLVVEYKNPTKAVMFPYASSQYSGMLIDYGL